MNEGIVLKPRRNDSLGDGEKLVEGKERKEYIPSDKAVANFLNLSEEGLGGFKKRLHLAHGHLRIWVHPLYTEQWPGSVGGRLGEADLSEVQDMLRESFLKTVDSVARNPDSSPLFVYEVLGHLKGTRKVVASRLGSEPGELEKFGIVFVPNERAGSQLEQNHLISALRSGNRRDKALAKRLMGYKQATDDFVEMSQKNSEELRRLFPQVAKDRFAPLSEEKLATYMKLTARHWSHLAPLLESSRKAYKKSNAESDQFMLALYRQLGLKSALVSGVYLEVGKNSETHKDELQACAGSVVSKLRSSDIPTDISNNIWPPKELIKAAGFDVKQTARDNSF